MRPIKLPPLAAALLLPLLLLAAAPARAAVPKTPKAYAFTVKSIELRDAWTEQSRGYPKRCKGWTKGEGLIRQTAQQTSSNIELDWIGGEWLTLGDEFKTRGTFERTLEFKGHLAPDQQPCSPCGPLSEYGECRPVIPDQVYRDRCGPRDGSFEMHLSNDGSKLTLFSGMGSMDHLAQCRRIPKDAWWVDAGPTSPDYGPVSAPGAASRLLRMGVGDRKTIRFSGRRGRCSRLGRRGMHSCSSIAATVIFKRTA